MRSCGSMFPTRIPRWKSIHSLQNASPVGNSATCAAPFASGSQSLDDTDRFMASSLRVLENRIENHFSVFAAEQDFTGALGVRHQAKDIAAFIADAGDVVERAVGVGGVGKIAVLRTVAEEDAVFTLELLDHGWFGEIVAFPVRDRDAQDLAFVAGVGEWRVGGFDAHMDVFAAEF